jgi:hypothetical protein
MIGAGRFGFEVFSWVLTDLPPLALRCPGTIATGGASATAVDIDDLLAVIRRVGTLSSPACELSGEHHRQRIERQRR